jgi:alginate O-acetyltransferase complex protein AlgJ
MAATFSDVVQLHYDKALADQGQQLARIVKQWQPDLVFITVVERASLSELFLVRPPGN